MITSWKTSLVGALVIIAASLAMAFGGLDKTAGGLLVTVGVGLILARDDKGGGAPPAAPAEKPAAPTVPPVPPLALLVIACLAVVGCARPIDTAIRATNGARSVGETARTAITAACVPAYKAANTSVELAAVDARCLPAERAYRVYAAAHAVAVVAIQRAQLGAATEADALAAALAVGQAGAQLADAVQGVTR